MAYCSSYYLYQRYEKRGDQDWIPSYPNVYSIDGEGSKPLRARQMYDTDCGWIPDTEPIYRWINVTPSSDPSTYWCDDCSSEYSGQYLTFVAIDSGTFSFSGTSSSTINNSSIEYSLDSGSTWNTLNRGVQSPTITAGNKIMWRSIWLRPQVSSNEGTGFFTSTGRFNVEGNAMSLFYETFQNRTSLSGVGTEAFKYLFRNCTGLVNAENLVLPATTLTNYCYSHMFEGCTSLTSIPELPARTLTAGCYEGMFAFCSSLTTVPSNYLPTTTLANHCYRSMFYCCSSLTSVPELPATTLASQCYDGMFYGCTSLTSVPSNYLPSTTLAEMCYSDMFSGCTSLTAAPQLPATTLTYYCYSRMFQSCTSLTTAPVLSATTLATGCYSQMFAYCSLINYIRCLATDISATDCTKLWLYNVSSSGTFVKASSMSSWPSGSSGIPSNWTVQNT